jgi:hypothetical protein
MLEQKLKSLAELQKELEEAQAWEEARREKLEALPEYQAVEKIKEARLQLISQIDEQRRENNELTLKAYQETGEKNPASGVGIRVYSRFDYDEGKAFDYCRGRLPAALKLDKRKFEKYVKGVQEVQPLDFVEITDDPRPTIASDLSEYLT